MTHRCLTCGGKQGTAGQGTRCLKCGCTEFEACREHIEDGEFKSHKYRWSKKGFMPLKLTDPDARHVLRIYAERRKKCDAALSEDLVWAMDEIERQEAKTDG